MDELAYMLCSPDRLVRREARRIVAREEADPWVWCAEFRHRRQLTAVNTGKTCPLCKEEGAPE